MDHPRRPHPRPQNPIRHRPRHVARNILDADQHLLYVRLVPDVPLGAGRAVRVQRRRLRQPEHVGANRQWRSIHAREEIPPERADSAVPTQHALYALWLDLLHHQLPGGTGGRDTETPFGERMRAMLLFRGC